MIGGFKNGILSFNGMFCNSRSFCHFHTVAVFCFQDCFRHAIFVTLGRSPSLGLNIKLYRKTSLPPAHCCSLHQQCYFDLLGCVSPTGLCVAVDVSFPFHGLIYHQCALLYRAGDSCPYSFWKINLFGTRPHQ
jgi:hypothetical protein